MHGGDRFAGIGTDGKYLYTTNCRIDDDGYVVLDFLFSEDGNSWTYADRFISGYSSDGYSPYYVLPGGVDGTNYYIITGRLFFYYNDNTFVNLTTFDNIITNYIVKNFQGFSVIVPIINVSPFTWYSISKNWKPEKYTNGYFNNNEDSYHSVAVLNESFYINYGGYMYSNYYYRYLLGKYCETSDDTQYVKIK